MTGFEVYCIYLSLKAHFTQKGYDCFKYNWKTKASYSKFQTRSDRYFFEKIGKKKDPKGFLLANMLVNPAWIGDLVNNEEAEQNYTEWQKRIQSLGYSFRQDLKKLDEDFDSNLLVEDGQHPKALILYMQGEISLETLTILVDMTGCFKYWSKQMEGDPVWAQYSLRISKYVPFLTYDKMKMRDIIMEVFVKED